MSVDELEAARETRRLKAVTALAARYEAAAQSAAAHVLGALKDSERASSPAGFAAYAMLQELLQVHAWHVWHHVTLGRDAPTFEESLDHYGVVTAKMLAAHVRELQFPTKQEASA